MITDEELAAMDRRIQAAGSANCWTGTAGSIAADARRLVREIRGPRRPRLIGLTGPAGCGKDLAASMMIARRIGFADPLYRGLATMLGVPEQVLRNRATKELPILTESSPRRLLQTLGTEWGRRCVAETLWVDLARGIWRDIRSRGESVVVTDVRFENEAEAIRADGGEVWLIHRPETAPVEAHSSEAGIPLRLIDRLIVNDGTVDQLRERVRETVRLADA